MSGWIKLSRQLSSNDLWLGEAFTRGQAWVDLLMLTNHSDGFIRVSGQKIIINRGQCGWSQLRLSERWKWSRGKTKRFFNELENERMIELKTNNRNTIVTICNYSKFQSANVDDGTPDDTPDDTTDGHQTDIKQYTKKNDKKEKKEKKLDFAEKVDNKEFDLFWSVYPLKTNKPQALKSWLRLTDANRKLAYSKLSGFIAGLEDWQLPLRLHAATYLNNKRWEDESAPIQPAKNDPQQRAYDIL